MTMIQLNFNSILVLEQFSFDGAVINILWTVLSLLSEQTLCETITSSNLPTACSIRKVSWPIPVIYDFLTFLNSVQYWWTIAWRVWTSKFNRYLRRAPSKMWVYKHLLIAHLQRSNKQTGRDWVWQFCCSHRCQEMPTMSPTLILNQIGKKQLIQLTPWIFQKNSFMGFTPVVSRKPSAIQQRAVQHSILGRDLIAQAQSRTASLLSYNSFNTRNDAFMLLNTIF